MTHNTHHDYKAMQLYEQLNILQANNSRGRHDDRIKELKQELEHELQQINFSDK